MCDGVVDDEGELRLEARLVKAREGPSGTGGHKGGHSQHPARGHGKEVRK